MAKKRVIIANVNADFEIELTFELGLTVSFLKLMTECIAMSRHPSIVQLGSGDVADDDSKKVAVSHLILDTCDPRKYWTRHLVAVRAFTDPTCLPYIDSKHFGSQAILVTRFEENGTLEPILKCEFYQSEGSAWMRKKSIITFGLAFGMELMHE
jgi:hypothetical protein